LINDKDTRLRMETKEFQYHPRCSSPRCVEPALYKIAAAWSNGSSRELKNYGLACEAHRDSQLARAQIHSQGVALAEGETVGKVGVYRLKTGVRDVALVRLADH
jgi:hypothetical protein